MEIKNVETKEKLREVFNFLTKLFYEEAVQNNEHYYTMSERYIEMSDQFEKDKQLLLYMEEEGKIIAALTSKKMDKENKNITLGVMGVDKEFRGKGIAKLLVKEMEKRCKDKDILHLDFGARIRACPVYAKLGYKPSLMVQVFDFVNIEEVKKANIFNLKEKSSWQSDTYGFVIFEVPGIDLKYVNEFESKVPTAYAQFIFEKDL